MSMAYRKHSQYANRSDHNRSSGRMYVSKHPEQLEPSGQQYSRYDDPDGVKPRRRRWAAGYIDRHSCPSYAYIDTRTRSPEMEYPSDTEHIAQPTSKEDGYIQRCERYDIYSDRHSDRHSDRQGTSNSEPRHSRNRSASSKIAPEDDRRRVDTHEQRYGSDLENLDSPQPRYTQTTMSTSNDSEAEEGSDIVIVERGSHGSDVASIHSRCSSERARSDVQDRRRKTDSDSDDDGGYISLDDYITGRSDCVSNRSLSEDEGEGSDAVGSGVEATSEGGEGSDVADGSDVVSWSDGRSWDDEDCIEYGHEDYIDGYRTA